MAAVTAAPTQVPDFLQSQLDQSVDEESDLDDLEEQYAEDEDIPENDEEEEELERLVFGESADFRQRLRKLAESAKDQNWEPRLEGEDDDEEVQDTGLGHLEDTELFYFDADPSQALIPAHQAHTSDNEEFGPDPPAWQDSDDERIRVSLASASRLRKLRVAEEEDVITGTEYIKRLRRQFRKLNPTPEWVQSAPTAHRVKRRRTSHGEASTSESESDAESDLSAAPLASLLRTSRSLVASSSSNKQKRRNFRPEVLNIQRMRDIAPSGASAINVMHTHPTLPLLLTAGTASLITLYKLHPHPPDHNETITTVYIPRTGITSLQFAPSADDARVFFSGRRRWFHAWDLANGKVAKVTRVYGHQNEQRSMETFKISPDGAHIAFLGSARKGGGVLNILDAQTLQWLAQARVEGHGGVADFAWWQNSRGVCIAGKNGEVSEWDLEQRRVVARWRDEGAVGTTVIALGGNSGRNRFVGGDRWVAVGSSSGIVNVYDPRPWGGEGPEDNDGVPTHPKPAKVLDQLTTPTSHLAFSPDGQILCMASRWKKDALRLVHLPSCAVYKNWPTAQTPLGRISAVAWGEVEGSMLLLVANEQGQVKCWELRD